MKKTILCCILSIGLFSFSFSQEYGWTDISANIPEQSVLTDVQFILEEGWITGGNAKVYYTPDGGNTFQIQELPENSGIASSIFMKNNLNGYVTTYSGNILKTDDGGTNWTTLHEPGGTLNSVHFPPNSDTGFACGNSGKIWSFDDFSITDLSVTGLTATLISIMFPVNSSEGKLCGEATIRRWLNSTWVNLQIFNSTIIWNGIFFTDNNKGWVVGSAGQISKTIDATIWNPQMSGTTKSLNDVFFIDSLEGWAAGTETLLHTVDGGETWTQEIASQTIGMELVATYFTSAHNGYVVGTNTLLKYSEVSGISDRVETIIFEISPNPAKNKVEIKCSEFGMKNYSIQICDLSGKTLIEKQVLRVYEKVEIDVNDLAGGVYFCTLRTDKKSSTKKLIIE
jgi:photosystem II stability/assembly factor-like uncharacterized protein